MGYGIIKKIIRGSIWFYNEPSDITQAKLTAKDRTMAYSHPYLILSVQSQLDNPKNPLVIGVPMTTNCTKSGRYDITTTDLDGKQSRILCGQVTSIDVQFIGGYIGTADENLLEQVEEFVLASMNITTVRGYEEKLKTAEKEVKELRDSVTSLTAELEELRKALCEKDSELEELKSPPVATVEEVEQEVEQEPVAESEPVKQEAPLPKQDGVEMSQRDFDILKAAETLSYKEIAEIYGVSQKYVSNKLYNLRKQLGISPRAKKDTQISLDDIEVVKADEIVNTTDTDSAKYDEAELLEMEYFGKVSPNVKSMSKKRRERYA